MEVGADLGELALEVVERDIELEEVSELLHPVRVCMRVYVCNMHVDG